MTFGERLSLLLRFKNIKQKDLAETVGVSKCAVSSWCNKTIPMLVHIEMLARALDVSVEALIGKEPVLDELLDYYNGNPRLIA